MSTDATGAQTQESYRSVVSLISKDVIRKSKFRKYVPIRVNVRVGRNQLCICGSGLKFKRCCGRYFEDERVETNES